MGAAREALPLERIDADFLTLRQVARVLGYGVERFNECALDELGIPYVKRLGVRGSVRVSKAALRRWAVQHAGR